MTKFHTNEALNLDISELKTETNRRLPAGYSAACMLSDDGVAMEIYDGDVMIMSIPIGGMEQKDALDKIEKEIEEL